MLKETKIVHIKTIVIKPIIGLSNYTDSITTRLNFAVFIQTISNSVIMENFAHSHIPKKILLQNSSITQIMMMIFSCFTTKLYGVHLILRHMTRPFVSTPIIGRISEGNHTYTNTIQFRARIGKLRISLLSIITDVLIPLIV